MSNAKHISLSVLLLLLGVTFSYGQSGHGDIEGTVTDAFTGETLVGVNVTIDGTSIGAAADLDGHFVLRRVPSGNHVLVFSYIGYETSRRPIEVRSGERLEVDMALTEERITGDEVTISAQRQGQQQAINRQITSDHIVNVVSEARLQELPDFNAAAALSRLPGISTQKSSGEDNKVVIRGLSPKYNAVEVEGVRLSATGSTQIGLSSNPNQGNTSVSSDRSVDLTTVSPYMIRMISLYKALTPDMNANAIGGTVNMELREAPRGPRGSLLLQGGYTAKSSTYGNYRAIASASNRFFNDKLGAYAFLLSESYDRDADNLTADYGIRADAVEQDPGTGFRPVQVNSVTFNRHLETRDRYGANLILDYNIPHGSLKSINMYTRLNSDYTDHRQAIEYGTGRMNWNLRLGEGAIDQRLHTLKMDYDLRFLRADLSASYSSSSNVLDGSPS
ncbi:MAG TPA: carboxypeptidase-like regulatory domain-containing protein, partial [Rhodothermales bacterium]|nr:carboxypeptidase-like regulatory domain-containing protein [Rhodothermales bacterium]